MTRRAFQVMPGRSEPEIHGIDGAVLAEAVHVTACGALMFTDNSGVDVVCIVAPGCWRQVSPHCGQCVVLAESVYLERDDASETKS